MWYWVRRLWIWQRVVEKEPSTAPTVTFADDPRPPRRWWWPGDWLRASPSPPVGKAVAPVEEQARLVVVHAGGAVLRASPTIHSRKVGSLRRGEVVPVIKEAGRRALVQMPEGPTAWISMSTPEGEPIVRRVTSSTQYKDKEMPLEGTSAFADAFEARWQEKWNRLRVDADRKEARPNTMRSSVPGLPIGQWRPSGRYQEGSGKNVLRARVRRHPRPPQPPQAVPKLEQPQSARTSIQLQKDVAAQKLLAELQEEDSMQLPDLIGFDTWPRAAGGNERVPSLAELLGGREQGAGLLGSTRKGLDDDAEVEEELGNEALVFNTEPSPSVASRSKLKVSAKPPRRNMVGLSVVDTAGKPPKEMPMGSDSSFQYLLKDLEQDLSSVPEASTEDSPVKAVDVSAPAFEGGGEDDLTAAEVLMSFPEPYPDAPNSPSSGFQYDTVENAWAKRSAGSRKAFVQKPARPSRRNAVQADLDVEQFAEAGQGEAGNLLLSMEGALASPEAGISAFDDLIGAPSPDIPQMPLFSGGVAPDSHDVSSTAPMKPTVPRQGLMKGLCEISAGGLANLAEYSLTPPPSPRLHPASEEASKPVAAAPSLLESGANSQALPAVPVLPGGGPNLQAPPARVPTSPAKASPLSQSNLLDLATLPAALTPTVAHQSLTYSGTASSSASASASATASARTHVSTGDIPDLTTNPFFDVKAQDTPKPVPLSESKSEPPSDARTLPSSHAPIPTPVPLSESKPQPLADAHILPASQVPLIRSTTGLISQVAPLQSHGHGSELISGLAESHASLPEVGNIAPVPEVGQSRAWVTAAPLAMAAPSAHADQPQVMSNMVPATRVDQLPDTTVAGVPAMAKVPVEQDEVPDLGANPFFSGSTPDKL